jgi:hypothetical protein
MTGMSIALWVAAVAGGTVAARVVDGEGRPLAGVIVFAADTTRVIGMAVSDGDGGVALPAPRPRYNFGLLSPVWRLGGLTPRGRGRYDLVAAPVSPAVGDGRVVARIEAGRAEVQRGRVVDETGSGLAGVRLEAVRGSGAVASTTFSGEGGRFALVVPGGSYGLRASAPGLEGKSGDRKEEGVVVVMGIAAEVQTISVTQGHTLSFRPSDSIDPEYSPPAPVRAWLQFAYGLCPSSFPLRAHEKRALKKYWYLDVLRREPPNPATISTVTCSPPSAMDRLPRGQTSVHGFEIWEETAGPPAF